MTYYALMDSFTRSKNTIMDLVTFNTYLGSKIRKFVHLCEIVVSMNNLKTLKNVNVKFCLMCGSCHFDKASNDEFSVECLF